MITRVSIILLFICSNAYSQFTLTGKILEDSTKTPLEAAGVYLPELRLGVIADSNGSYIIKNIPAGKFLIEAQYLSYKTQSIYIQIKKDTTLHFFMKPEIIETHEIIVRSDQPEEIENSSPGTIVKKQDLLQNASTNIIDAISKQPGISQICTGAGISKPVIRGLGYTRVIVANDGIRQEGQQWGDEHGIEVDEYGASKIEILKGPNTLMYGSDGLGGVINILSQRPVPTGKVSGSLLSNYQSNNNLQGYSAMIAGNNGKLSWANRFSTKIAGNYKNAYDGYVYNSGYREFNGNGNVALNRKWGYTQLGYSLFNQRLALSEGERDSLGQFTKETVQGDSTIVETVNNADLNSYKIGVPNQLVQHYKIFMTNFIVLRNSHLSITTGYQQNRRREFGNLFSPDPDLYFFLQTINYHLKYMLQEKKGWEVTSGISGMQQFNSNKGKEFLIPEYHLSDAGIFGVARKKIKSISLNVGLRADLRTIDSEELQLDSAGNLSDSGVIKFTSFKNNYYNFSGSTGIVFSPKGKKYQIRLNAARGFRPPNISELASNGRHEGSFRYEIGNTKLKAETSFQLDAGYEYNSEHVSLQMNVFSNLINNYIFPSRLNSANGGDSLVIVDDEMVPVFKYSSGKAELYGSEITLDIHPHPLDWLHVGNSLGFVRGVNLGMPDSSRNLPFIPAAKWLSELRVNFKKIKSRFGSFYAKLESDYTFAQNNFLAENNTETATPSYLLFNAGAGTDILHKKGRVICSVYLSVNNIFNVAYQSHLSRLKYAPENQYTGRQGIFNMGRNVSIKLLVPLYFKD